MGIFDRQINLIGEEGIIKLKNTEITILGLGGVGSYTLETLTRIGVGTINIVDNDIIDITNINRQLYALYSTIGKKKVEIAYERCIDINPKVIINKYDLFIDSKEQIKEIIKNSDYVLDCIDTIDSKIKIVEVTKKLNIPLISSMGTGNKLDPSKLVIMDIFKTTNCPLSKKIRKELRKRDIDKLKVICSNEENKKIDKEKQEIATVSFVPSMAGILITAECIKDILNSN